MVNPSELMTIKAFAAASGRSQQTIYKQIGTRLAPYVHEISGQKYIEGRAMAEVFKIGENQPNQPEINSTKATQLNSRDAEIWDEVKFLRSQLEAKDKFYQEQLAVKDELIKSQQSRLDTKETEILNLTAALENMSKSVNGAQALHAGTMQQLESGEQPDQECRDEIVVDAEPGDPEPQQSAPEQKASFRDRWRKAMKILKGE